MKKAQILLFLLLITQYSFGQIKSPSASPRAWIKQDVGLTQVEVDYSRPSAREREVFGGLVSFGKLWRTGANANTIVSISDDIIIDGKTLPKGHYSLYSIPSHTKWDIYFYTTTDNWGNPTGWDETKIALKTTVSPELLDRFVETFTINVSVITNESGVLELTWANTIVSIPFQVPTEKAVMESIKSVMNGPSDSDYYAAALYYFQSLKDSKQALDWVNKAVTMKGEDGFWYLRLKALLHYRLGDKKMALETAKRSLDSAKRNNNMDYVKLNTESIEEWNKK